MSTILRDYLSTFCEKLQRTGKPFAWCAIVTVTYANDAAEELRRGGAADLIRLWGRKTRCPQRLEPNVFSIIYDPTKVVP